MGDEVPPEWNRFNSTRSRDDDQGKLLLKCDWKFRELITAESLTRFQVELTI